MDESDSEVERIRGIVAPIALKYGVERMYLFGSRARGDYTDDSDHDFCIVPGDIHGLICLSKFMTDLEGALGTEVDIVFERSASPSFAETISHERKLIYE
ncbi:MAG: nucleotidyltransferase domain-containing protein [Candidatus Methanoplasma sp.]|jgi:predicted nucleotidyltransferase|nr:nucleotidyltransferase domain-containing protein [Candidatus Methanoplasma sp.]